MPIAVGGGAEPCRVDETRICYFASLVPLECGPQAATVASGMAYKFYTGRARGSSSSYFEHEGNGSSRTAVEPLRRMVEINLAVVCDCDATDMTLLCNAGGRV